MIPPTVDAGAAETRTAGARVRTGKVTLAIASLALVVVAVTACGNSVEPSASPPAPSASPANVETTTPSVDSPASPSANDGFGPLAVIRAPDGTDTALTQGTLRVTKDCVLLETTSGLELLVWPADRTTWDAKTAQVGFTNFDGTIVQAGDGTRVRVGGGGSSNGEDGTTSQAWLAQMAWVQRPASSCPLASRWFVGGLERDAS